MNRTNSNRLARLEAMRNAGVVVIDLCSDGEHTQADLDRAKASGQRVVLLIDDEEGER